MWANGSCETTDFALQLAQVHDVTALTETRETEERRMFLKSWLPAGIQLFSSGIDQFKGGIAQLVKHSFLDQFNFHNFVVLAHGRIAKLELAGAHGCMHVYIIYLDPESASEREVQMRSIAAKCDPHVHNIVLGDFNFAANDSDRISKTGADCHSNNDDRRNANTWNDIAAKLGLKEFVQDSFTCENSHGWSRIDRVYTNLHLADISRMRCACNVVDHPRHLSDHKPVSISIKKWRKARRRKTIQRWVMEHNDFAIEAEEEYTARLGDFERLRRRTPTSFDKLQIYKDSVHAAAAFIRRRAQAEVARTTEHRMAICMSFLRAIYDADLRGPLHYKPDARTWPKSKSTATYSSRTSLKS